MIIKLLDTFPNRIEELLISRCWNDFGLDRIEPFTKGIVLEGSEDDILDFVEDFFDCEPEDAPSYFEVISVD